MRQPDKEEQNLFHQRSELLNKLDSLKLDVASIEQDLENIEVKLSSSVTSEAVDFESHLAQWVPASSKGSERVKESFGNRVFSNRNFTEDACLNMNFFNLVKPKKNQEWAKLGIRLEHIFHSNLVPAQFEIKPTPSKGITFPSKTRDPTILSDTTV